MKVKVFTILLICVPLFLSAQWTDNPSFNTKIADTNTAYQVQPKVVVDESGNSFISWFSAGDDFNFDVYMQRLDVNGNKLWDEEGLLISNHQTATWTTDYGLALESSDNAILVNQDMRTGSRCVFAWKISPDGDFLWGNDGIALSDNSSEDYSPKVQLDQENNAIVMWEAVPHDTNDFIKTVLRKISPDGTVLWNGLTIENDTADCWMPQMINTEDCTIVVWIETDRDTSHAVGNWEFMYPFAQKIDGEGNFVWAEPVQLDDAMNMPLFPFTPSLKPDGNGGLFVSWMAFPEGSIFYTCFAQHINTNGEVQWVQNGINVTDSTQFSHTDPHVVVFPDEEGIAVFWNEQRIYSGTDEEVSVYGQKLSLEGNRLWSAQGKAFDGPYNIFDTNTLINDAQIVGQNNIALFYNHSFMAIEGMDTLILNNIYASKFNSGGDPVWAERTTISNVQSEVFSIDVSNLEQDQWIMVWEDNRNDPNHDFMTGIYAQNIDVNGDIGPTSVSESISYPVNISVYPNPCKQNTCISFTLQHTTMVDINVLDLNGKLVKRISKGILQKGDHQFVVDTKSLDPGIYVLSINKPNYRKSQKLVKY